MENRRKIEKHKVEKSRHGKIQKKIKSISKIATAEKWPKMYFKGISASIIINIVNTKVKR
jgi:hypothetical protein